VIIVYSQARSGPPGNQWREKKAKNNLEREEGRNMPMKQVSKITVCLCLVAELALTALPVMADSDDPPARVARLAYAQGSVSFQPAGTDDWVTPGLNRPMTTGDKMWADNDGRVELQLDGSVLRLANNTGFSFLNLNDNVTQIQLTAGTLLVRVRRLDPNETYEIDTPNLAFSIVRPGVYRIGVNEAGDSTFLTTGNGEGEVTGSAGATYAVRSGDAYSFTGTDQLHATRENPGGENQFEAWAANRDRRWESSRSGHYVSADVIGYQDLDEYGDWRPTPDYGTVWFPRASHPDWAPYHDGHWDYIEPWGYTWVDDEPWGFAPFHYGRWVYYRSAWGWVPTPPRVERVEYVRPVYAPALVAWVGGGGGGVGVNVGWFALGPREVYVPSYPVSRAYVNRVNVSNTTVNTTVVNNYYNTTVVNKDTTATNVNYVNRNAPGAVVATTPQVLASAQPVAKNIVRVDAKTVQAAPVRAAAPAVAPAKQAVLGPAAPARVKPPAKVETRTVVAKAAPPPPLPSFEKRQAAIQSNGGKPLSTAQMRQIQPTAPATPPPTVKIAPAAKPAATPPPPNRATQPAKPAPTAPNTAPAPNRQPTPKETKPEPDRPSTPNPAPPNRPAERHPAPNPPKPEPIKPAPNPPPPNRPADRPPTAPPPSANPSQQHRPTDQPAERPPERPAPPSKPPEPPPRTDRPTTAPPVHPKEQPSAPRATVPPSQNPAVDQKHQQQQDQLRARQEQERQKLQQQQEQQHAKVAQQQADQAKQRQMEQQHQQQTQELEQKQAQQQKQLQQKQQQERQKQEKQQQQKPQKPQPPPQPQQQQP